VSEQNLAIVRRAIEAFNRGGVDALMAYHHPEVVSYPLPEWLEETVYRGHEGIRAQFEWMGEFNELSWETHEVREVGDDVLIHATLVGRTSSGVEIHQAFGAVCSDFRDGLVTETRYYRTWPEALESVGLRD
jgi:ketosteroid isomerase-like protein